MATLNVLYFAHVRHQLGISSEVLEIKDEALVSDALEALVLLHPTLARLLPSLRVALDGEFVASADRIPPGHHELVLIPPVSGGSGAADAEPAAAAQPARTARVALSDAPLDATRLAQLQGLVSGNSIGGIAVFIGQVRDHARGRSVTHLDYEAYPAMALKQMHAICDAVELAYPGTRTAIHHRTGRLQVGDIAVIAAAGSAHRAAAFEATRELIERLKADVPIWKREAGPDGEVWVSDRP